jgi:hypothetical protein
LATEDGQPCPVARAKPTPELQGKLITTEFSI